jgi:hypothetical protein
MSISTVRIAIDPHGRGKAGVGVHFRTLFYHVREIFSLDPRERWTGRHLLTSTAHLNLPALELFCG